MRGVCICVCVGVSLHAMAEERADGAQEASDLEPFEEIGAEEEARSGAKESGMRFGADLVAAEAFGSLGEAVAPGLGGGIWLGYEGSLGPIALVPRLTIQYVHFFSGETRPVGVEVNTDASTTTVFPGLGLTVRMPARPFLGFGLGYGRLRVSDEGGGLSGTSKDSAFGIGVQGRVEFRVAGGMMLGVGSDYTIVFTRVANTRWATFGLTMTFFL